MSTPFDEDVLQEGLATGLLGSRRGTQFRPGLGDALTQQTPQPASTNPDIETNKPGDLLLILQRLGRQTPSSLIESQENVRIPTMAPPAAANATPQRASMPGDPIPNSQAVQATLGDIIESRRPDLGAEGNTIRHFLQPGFTRDSFDNYWLGKGDYNLSDERFKDIAGYAGAQDPPDSKDVIGSNGEHLQQRLYSFYGLPDYNRSLGRSTLFYDQSGRPVGFYDYYNFDPGVNKRDWLSEVETRAMHMLPKPASAKPFKIRYGESPTPN